MIWCAHAVQTLHVMLQDCIECMGVGANMGRSDNIAEEGARAVSAVAQGASVAKEMGDVRCRLHKHLFLRTSAKPAAGNMYLQGLQLSDSCSFYCLWLG